MTYFAITAFILLIAWAISSYREGKTAYEQGKRDGYNLACRDLLRKTEAERDRLTASQRR